VTLLPCPWCGNRNVSEFHALGEPKKRPDPSTATPQEWRGYLYLQRNACGWILENWYHRAGCRRFFAVERHTLTNEIRVLSRKVAADAPADPAMEGPDMRGAEL
jgi:sarcosine oxidase, subunit delta